MLNILWRKKEAFYTLGLIRMNESRRYFRELSEHIMQNFMGCYASIYLPGSNDSCSP